MTLEKLFFYLGSSFATILVITKIVEKIISIKERNSKKLNIKVDIPAYGWGYRQRTEKEKEELKHFSSKLPNLVPDLDIHFRFINNSKRTNVIDIYIYLKKKNGEMLNLGGIKSITLNPMKPIEKNFQMNFNWANELKFWKGINWEEREKDKIAEYFDKVKLDGYLYVEIIDAHEHKETKKLPL